MSPLPHFATGEPLGAAEANLLARQGVIVEPTTSSRDALPAPHDGMVCYVEADQTHYVRRGGQWRTLWRDTGWEEITPASGFTSVVAQVRCIGSVVYLRGRLDGVVNTGQQNLIGTVPSGFRPAGGADNAIGAVHVSAFANNTFWANVTAAGEIRVIPTTSGSHAMRLKGLSGYTVD